MRLEDSLKEIIGSTQGNNDNEVTAPYKTLKNNIVRLSKKSPDFMVRILPGKDGGAWFAKYRSVSVNINNKFTALTMSAQRDEADPVQQAVDVWSKADKFPNRFNSKPSYNFYVNIVPVVMQKVTKDGVSRLVAREMLLPNGLPKVYVLQLNNNLMRQIGDALQDEAKNPNLLPNLQSIAQNNNFRLTEDMTDYSFISSAFAYPIRLHRVTAGKVSSVADVESNYPLMPLKQGWESQLEDLAYQATPTYKYNPSWVTHTIANANKALGLNVPTPEAPSVDMSDMPNDFEDAPEQVSQVPKSAPQDKSAMPDPFASQAVSFPSQAPLQGFSSSPAQSQPVAEKPVQQAPMTHVQPAIYASSDEQQPAQSQANDAKTDVKVDDILQNLPESLRANIQGLGTK